MIKMNNVRLLFVGALILHLLSLCFDSDVGFCLAAAPLLLGTLAAAGGSLLNAGVNHMMSSYDARLQNKYTKELMDYQWDKFISPKAQAAGLAEAGLNPSVVFGQGSMTHTATPSAQSAPISLFDFGMSGADLTNSVLALSQAKKAGSETAGIELDNKIKESSLNELIKSAGIANKWQTEETNRVMQEAYNLQGQNNKLQEEIKLLRKQGVTLDLENENWQKRFDAEMRAYADKHNIDAQELKQMQEQAPYILGKLKSEDSLLNLESEVQGDFKEVNAKLGVVGKVLGFISEFVKKR